MLGFITVEKRKVPGRLSRWRHFWQRGYGTETEERRLFGRKALFVRYEMTEGLASRQAAARRRELGRILARNGVSKLTVSANGAASELEGIGPGRMESSYLYSCLAGDVGAYVAGGSGATAACFLRTVGPLEERAILKLARAFRHLMISTAHRDGAAVVHALQRRYGLAVVENPTPSQTRRADFALLFYPPPQAVLLGGQCIHFAPDERMRGKLSGGRPITGLSLDLPSSVQAELPEGFSWDPILSEAAFCGSLDPEKIKIHSVSIDKRAQNDYNIQERVSRLYNQNAPGSVDRTVSALF